MRHCHISQVCRHWFMLSRARNCQGPFASLKSNGNLEPVMLAGSCMQGYGTFSWLYGLQL
jgi:hypothetical protein